MLFLSNEVGVRQHRLLPLFALGASSSQVRERVVCVDILRRLTTYDVIEGVSHHETIDECRHRKRVTCSWQLRRRERGEIS